MKAIVVTLLTLFILSSLAFAVEKDFFISHLQVIYKDIDCPIQIIESGVMDSNTSALDMMASEDWPYKFKREPECKNIWVLYKPNCTEFFYLLFSCGGPKNLPTYYIKDYPPATGRGQGFGFWGEVQYQIYPQEFLKEEVKKLLAK